MITGKLTARNVQRSFSRSLEGIKCLYQKDSLSVLCSSDPISLSPQTTNIIFLFSKLSGSNGSWFKLSNRVKLSKLRYTQYKKHQLQQIERTVQLYVWLIPLSEVKRPHCFFFLYPAFKHTISQIPGVSRQPASVFFSFKLLFLRLRMEDYICGCFLTFTTRLKLESFGNKDWSNIHIKPG